MITRKHPSTARVSQAGSAWAGVGVHTGNLHSRVNFRLANMEYDLAFSKPILDAACCASDVVDESILGGVLELDGLKE